jgi:hypothetical protein
MGTSFYLPIEFVVRCDGAGAGADQFAKVLLGFTASRFPSHTFVSGRDLEEKI